MPGLRGLWHTGSVEKKPYRNRIAATLAATLAAFGARPPFAAEDLWEWRSPGDPRMASGGDRVAYVESWNDRSGDAEFSNLWVVSSNGKTRRRLTEGHWRDRSPRWSPDDARIAWLSDRTGRPQVWVRKLESGPETQVTSVEGPPESLAWSPDGESIAFTALAPAKTNPPAWAPPEIVPRLRRLREGYVQLFVVAASGGAARQISSGDFDVTGEPAWMPDGRSILAARDDGEIYSFRVSDGTAKQLTRQGGRNEQPLPSPDGGKIAWLATAASQSLRGPQGLGDERGRQPRPSAERIARSRRGLAPVELRFAHRVFPGGRSRLDPHLRGAQRRHGAPGDQRRGAPAELFAGG